jgi:TorA maturation chaperone TorD
VTGSAGNGRTTGLTRHELLGAILAATFGADAASLHDHLASGRLQRALRDLAEVAGTTAPDLPSPSLEGLQVARVNLFSANPSGLPAPPYAGMAIDGRILGPSVDRLEALLSAHGYAAAPGATELPDHLAAIGAVLADDACPASLSGSLEHKYLRPWLERYAGPVATADETGVFNAITGFLAQLFDREVVRAPQA